jgi:uroporphyrinogen decarboxylase
MHKRERLERAIAGEAVDRPPVALWRHWPGDDQRYADLARSIIDFQHDYNWDFARVMPARSFQVTDYGLQDEWCGTPSGIRAIKKRVIKRSLDWTQLRPLTPARGALSQQVECLRLICGALEPDNVPVLQTIYSPLAQAAQLAGPQRVLRDMRVRPDRLRTGLDHLTESTLRFLESLRKLPGLAGIFIVTRFASHDILSEAEYTAFGLPQLESIRSSLPEHWWLNIAQVAGPSPMLKLIGGLQFQAYNWDAGAGSIALAEAMNLFEGATCGGLDDQRDLLRGTPALLQSSVRIALEQCNQRRLFLSGSGEGLLTTPISNIRAIRSIVERSA